MLIEIIKKRKRIILWGVYIICLYLFFNYVIGPVKVVSGSMEPTLMTGDLAVVNMLRYVFREPQRGEIIAFRHEEFGDELIMKRIIGLPGDHIDFQDGCVFVNDTLLEEEYIGDDVKTLCWLSFDVPVNSYFVLGDNREHSLDSRFWDDPYVSEENIVGSYIGTIWHAYN